MRTDAAAAALLLAAAGAAAETSPWYLGASLALGHASNVPRLSDGEVREGLSRSDTVTSAALLGGLDQPVGRQRVYGTLALRDNRYARNAQYDNRSYSVNLGLDWATVERLSGTLAGSSSRSLSTLGEAEAGAERRRNLQRVDGLDASARVGVVTALTAETGYARREVSNSLEERGAQSREFTQDTLRLGLRWAPGGALSLGAALRESRGEFPAFEQDPLTGETFPDRYRSRDVDLVASWRASGASTLELRLSQGRTRYELNTERNFSGFTGSLNWIWRATGKTLFTLNFARDRGQDSYAFATGRGAVDYSRVGNALAARLEWGASAKLTFTGSASYTERELASRFGATGVQQTGRDRIANLAAGLRWTPRRALQFGCDAGRERRRGQGELGARLSASAVTCFGQLTAQ